MKIKIKQKMETPQITENINKELNEKFEQENKELIEDSVRDIIRKIIQEELGNGKPLPELPDNSLKGPTFIDDDEKSDVLSEPSESSEDQLTPLKIDDEFEETLIEDFRNFLKNIKSKEIDIPDKIPFDEQIEDTLNDVKDDIIEDVENQLTKIEKPVPDTLNVFKRTNKGLNKVFLKWPQQLPILHQFLRAKKVKTMVIANSEKSPVQVSSQELKELNTQMSQFIIMMKKMTESGGVVAQLEPILD